MADSEGESEEMGGLDLKTGESLPAVRRPDQPPGHTAERQEEEHSQAYENDKSSSPVRKARRSTRQEKKPSLYVNVSATEAATIKGEGLPAAGRKAGASPDRYAFDDSDSSD